MASRLVLAVVGAFSISLLGVGSGEAVVCDPHCAPAKSNKGGEVRGLNRANSVAGDYDTGDHGDRGRDNAATKQDLHKPGGSGVTDNEGTGGSTGGSTGGTTSGGSTGGTTGGTSGGTTPGLCTGC